MSDAIESTTSAPQSAYTASQQAAAATALDHGLKAVSSFKEKTSYLRGKDFWVGSKPRQDVVNNLYSLLTSGNITSEHWNKFGDAARSWEEQSGQIRTLTAGTDISSAAVPEESSVVPDQADTVTDPAIKTKDFSSKVRELREKGYWVGSRPRQDLVNGLYDAALAGNLSVSQWNKLGDSSKDWSSQSTQLRQTISNRAPSIDVPSVRADETVEPIEKPAEQESPRITTSAQAAAEQSVSESTMTEELKQEPAHYEPHVPEKPTEEPCNLGAPAAEAAVAEPPVPLPAALLSYAHLIPSEEVPEETGGVPAQTKDNGSSVPVTRHTVEEGDMLSKLAVRYHTTVQDIVENNLGVIDDPDRLSNGTVLNIRPGLDPMAIPSMFARVIKAANDYFGKETLHTVNPGENLSRIAQMYGIPLQRLIWDNKDTVSGSGNDLKPGQRLAIRSDELPEADAAAMRSYYNEVLNTEKMAQVLRQDDGPVSMIRNGVLSHYGTGEAPRAIEESVLNEFTSEALAASIPGSVFAKVPSGLKGGLYQLGLIKKIRENAGYKNRPLMEIHFDSPGGDQLRIFYRDGKQPKVWTAAGGVQNTSARHLFTYPKNTFLVEFGSTDTFSRGVISSTPEEARAFQEHFSTQLSELRQGMKAIGIENPAFIPGHGGTSSNSYLVTKKGNITGAETLVQGALESAWALHSKIASAAT